MSETLNATTTTWAIDPTHSEIGFKIRHLMITNVTGNFSSFKGNVTTQGDDFGTANIDLTIDTASVSTNSPDRDGHLKSADFFDAEKYPEIKFISTSVTKKSDDEYTVHGDLTMHGVTNPVTLNVEHAGHAKDPWGNQKSGFSINTKISRKEWGLTWNANLEAGGVLVSDDVKIFGEIQVVKQGA